MLLEDDILTARLRLSALSQADAKGPYLTWLQDPEVVRFLEVRHTRQTEESLASYIAQTNENPDLLLLGMFLKEGGRHIGNIKLGPIHPRYLSAHIGIMLGEKSIWGQGYAREAIGALSVYAFEKLGLHRLEAGAYSGNISSYKAFLASGFELEGRLREAFACEDGSVQDHLLMGRLAKS